jgi:glycerate kinase
MGFAFSAFLGARLQSGISLVLDAIRAEEYVQSADVVLTGEGRLDGQSAMGKAPVGVAKLAKKHGKPVIAFAGCVTEEAGKCNAEGIDAFFPILRGVVTLDEAMNTENAKHNLEKTAEQAFRLVRTFRK